jgi:hypothetical protein
MDLKRDLDVSALAKELDCFIEQELCVLCDIKAVTAEKWRKTHTGPAYIMVGNRVLYPKDAVRAFLARKIRVGKIRGVPL